MGRLLAVLGLLLAGMVLLPVGPAVAATSADRSYDAVVAALGAGSEPLSGTDLVAVEEPPWDWQRWFQLGIGVLGLTAISGLARRWWRSR